MENTSSFTSRWIISLPTKCESGKLEFLQSSFEIISPFIGVPNHFLIENITQGAFNPEEAFYASWEKINLFTIACSLIGFGQAQVKTHIATYSTNFDKHEAFDVVVPFVIQQEINEVSISQSQLQTLEEALSGNYSDAVICVASAIRTPSVEEKITLMHSGSQEMASVNSTATIKQNCKHCGEETDTGRPATNSYIRDIFTANSLDGVNTYKLFTELRHKIGHGKPIATLQQYLDARFTVAKAQGTVTHHLDSLIGLERTIGHQAVVGVPFAVYTFKRDAQTFSSSLKSYNSKVAFSKVMGKEDIPYDGYSLDFGARLDMEKIFTSEYLGYMFSRTSHA